MGGVFVRFIIFAQDRIRLGTKLKQVWFSAFDFFYLCKTITKNTYPTPNTKQHT